MTTVQPDEFWRRCVAQANDLRKILDDKPSHLRVDYSFHPGSILNAYREGDLTFGEATQILESEQFCDTMRRVRASRREASDRLASRLKVSQLETSDRETSDRETSRR